MATTCLRLQYLNTVRNKDQVIYGILIVSQEQPTLHLELCTANPVSLCRWLFMSANIRWLFYVTLNLKALAHYVFRFEILQ